MAYDREITGLCFWSSIGILRSLSLSVSQYQSQLGPLSVHFINKHDCPEVHAQLLIMWVSQTESFVIDLIWNFWGGAHDGDINSVTVSKHTEELGMLESETLPSCLRVWFWTYHMGVVCICEVLQSMSHMWQLKNTKRWDWTPGRGWNWTSSEMRIDREYHHSQFSCLDCLDFRFMFLVSDCHWWWLYCNLITSG